MREALSIGTTKQVTSYHLCSRPVSTKRNSEPLKRLKLPLAPGGRLVFAKSVRDGSRGQHLPAARSQVPRLCVPVDQRRAGIQSNRNPCPRSSRALMYLVGVALAGEVGLYRAGAVRQG